MLMVGQLFTIIPFSMRHSTRLVLLTVLLGHALHWISGHILKEVLKSEPSVLEDVTGTWVGVDVANIAGSEAVSQLSSFRWSVRVAFRHCLQTPHGNHYKAYQREVLVCINEYYQFCMPRNVVAHVQELSSQYARDCMQFRFSEPFFPEMLGYGTSGLPWDFTLI